MTRSSTEQFLKGWEGKGDIPITLPYKGVMRKAVGLRINKSGGADAEIEIDGKRIWVAQEFSSLSILPQANHSWEIPSQKPALKVGDSVKLELARKPKATPPYLTDPMRTLDAQLAKVTSIGPKGFYRLSLIVQPTVGVADITKYRWSDRWVRRLSKEELEYETVTKPFENLMLRYAEADGKRFERLRDDVRQVGVTFSNLHRSMMMSLASRNGKQKELIEKKKSDFLANIETLKKDTRIKSIDITPVGITVKTNRLSIKCTDIPIKRKFSFLPEYTIVVDFQRNEAITSFSDREDDGFRRGVRCHPHMGSGDGLPCLGNMAMAFRTAIAEFNLRNAVMIIVELLESYNSSNPFESLSNFYPKAPKCGGCGVPNVFWQCTNCGRKGKKVSEKTHVLPFKWDKGM
jgi:hypothetical protein